MLERHIVIGGSSYCGSTVFSLILGSIPGYKNVGASNMLTPRFGEKSSDPEIFHNYAKLGQCHACGTRCKIWTRTFRKKLQSDPSNWYRRIAKQMKARNLVSTERDPINISLLDPDLNNTTLVLFKSPFQHWGSVTKRPGKGSSLNAAMDTWSRIYTTFLDDEAYAPSGGKVFTDIESFLSDPEGNLVPFSNALDVPHVPAALEYWKTRQHYLGGNFNVYERKEREPGKLALTNVMVPIAPADEAAIRKHQAYGIYNRLLERSVV